MKKQLIAAVTVASLLGFAGGTAVQVIGPAAQVEKVKAVAQLEGEFNGIARANALIPMATTNVTNLNRVQGVGVSATIDFKF